MVGDENPEEELAVWEVRKNRKDHFIWSGEFGRTASFSEEVESAN